MADDSKTIISQAITKDTKIAFNRAHVNLSELTLRHNLKEIDKGVMLDKIISTGVVTLTLEDFYPEQFNGNELK